MKRLVAAILLCLPAACFGATYYVNCTPQGSANCSSAGNACNLTTLWAIPPVAGDHVKFADGTYSGSSSCMIVPPAGVNGNAGSTDADLITLEATNMPTPSTDIMVWIDGQNTRTPIDLRGHTGFAVRGIGAMNTATSDGNWLLGNSARYIYLYMTASGDAPINRNVQGYAYENNLITNGSPQPDLGPIVNDTYFTFGTSRKKSVVYATNLTSPGVLIKNGVDIWAGSINIGPKYPTSLCYHAKNTKAHDLYLFWTGSAMPSSYQLSSGSTWATETTSTTSHNISDTGPQTWTGAGITTSLCSLLTASNVKVQMQRHSVAGTWMRGYATVAQGGSCTAGSLKVNVTETGGSGSGITDWDVTRYYINSAVNQPYSLLGMDACGYTSPNYDQTTDVNIAANGIIAIARNSDAYTPSYGILLEYMTQLSITNSIVGYGTNWSSKYGFYLGPCANPNSTCATPKRLTASNLTCVGCSSNYIHADWTVTPAASVVRMANNTGFDWTGATGSNKANLCYLYDDNGNITTTPRWPWPLQHALSSAMTAAGYTPIDVQAEAATMFGAIPAACDSTQTTPTPTFTGTLTPTNTPSNTPSFTPSNTPSRTPTKTPTSGAGCTVTDQHGEPWMKGRFTHTVPCVAGTPQPHTIAPPPH